MRMLLFVFYSGICAKESTTGATHWFVTASLEAHQSVVGSVYLCLEKGRSSSIFHLSFLRPSDYWWNVCEEPETNTAELMSDGGTSVKQPPLVTVTQDKLTLGLFILSWWPPTDAGLMFIQIEEANQASGTSTQLHHLGPHLHRAHAFLHWRTENKRWDIWLKDREDVDMNKRRQQWEMICC